MRFQNARHFRFAGNAVTTRILRLAPALAAMLHQLSKVGVDSSLIPLARCPYPRYNIRQRNTTTRNPESPPNLRNNPFLPHHLDQRHFRLKPHLPPKNRKTGTAPIPAFEIGHLYPVCPSRLGPRTDVGSRRRFGCSGKPRSRSPLPRQCAHPKAPDLRDRR